MIFELWYDKKDNSYTLCEKPLDNTLDTSNYDFLVKCAELKVTFVVENFEHAVEMRNEYLNW